MVYLKANMKIGKRIGFLLLALLAAVSFMFLADLLLFGAYTLFMDVLNLPMQLLMKNDCLIEALVYMVMLGIYYGIFKLAFRKDAEEKTTALNGKGTGQSIAIGLGAAGISFLWLTLAEHIPFFADSMKAMDKFNAGMAGGNPVDIILITVIMAPLVEELIFRGVVFRSLEKVKEGWFPILASALLFGLCHVILVQSVYSFVLGVAAAIVYAKTRNMLYPVLIHMANNLMAALSSMVPTGIGATAINIFTAVMILPMFYFLYKTLQEKRLVVTVSDTSA